MGSVTILNNEHLHIVFKDLVGIEKNMMRNNLRTVGSVLEGEQPECFRELVAQRWSM